MRHQTNNRAGNGQHGNDGNGGEKGSSGGHFPNNCRTNGGNSNNNSQPNNNSSNSKPSRNSNSLFYADLRERLRNLGFTSFQNCVLLWLGARGYGDICVLKRTAARGRRKVGGADFIGESPHEPGVKVAIQVRHWQTPIQRRAVDELSGFMIRQGIPQGLIVTNNYFYPRALQIASDCPGRPIRLVSVAQLAGSMAALGLGVEPGEDQWTVSEAFFRTLGRLRIASSLTGPALPSLDQSGNCSGCLDSVSTNPPSRPDEPHLWWWLLPVILAFLALTWWLTAGAPR